MIAHRLGHSDSPNWGNLLQPRRYIDAIAEDVFAFDNYVAKIDANTEFDPAILWHPSIAIAHPALNFRSAGNRVDHAWKFHQHTVAR